MICIIRIKGQVGLNKRIKETLERLRLKRKFVCVVIKPTDENLGMIKKLRNFVAFGEIDDETFEKLIATRGKALDKTKKINAKEIIKELQKGKGYEELNLKPFFRLHPPRKGAHMKIHYPKGVLGDNKEKINNLVEKML